MSEESTKKLSRSNRVSWTQAEEGLTASARVTGRCPHPPQPLPAAGPPFCFHASCSCHQPHCLHLVFEELPPHWGLGLVLSSSSHDLALPLTSLSFLLPVSASSLIPLPNSAFFPINYPPGAFLDPPVAPSLPRNLTKETHGASCYVLWPPWRTTGHCNG